MQCKDSYQCYYNQIGPASLIRKNKTASKPGFSQTGQNRGDHVKMGKLEQVKNLVKTQFYKLKIWFYFYSRP